MENLFNDPSIDPEIEISNHSNDLNPQQSNSGDNHSISIAASKDNEDDAKMCVDIDKYLNGDSKSLNSMVDYDNDKDDLNKIKTNKFKFNPDDINNESETYIGYYAAMENKSR